MSKRFFVLLFALSLLLAIPASSLAQSYYFTLEEQTVHAYWNSDGTLSIDYTFVFANDPYGAPIEYVDVGLPNGNFNVNSIEAEVDGQPLSDISASGYQGSGTGVAIGLGSRAIPPGKRGTVHVWVGEVRKVLRPDSTENAYASAQFSPTYFGAQYVNGLTDLWVAFHLPPGVKPDEPRWHASPSGWASEPQTGIDDQGRVQYTWANAQANAYTEYVFGASFPRSYVPDSAISSPSFSEVTGISGEDLVGFSMCIGFIGFFVAVTALGVVSTNRRKKQYLPPKIAIEGHGIKRGLTAIEAAVLMEQPLDKVLTMILFAVIKKGAAEVVTKEPLKLKLAEPLPEGLQAYETDFLKAFQTNKKAEQKRALQTMMVDLVKSISQKMKGFSRKETLAYYQDIVKRAWTQVEAAATPEVKSAKYDEVMEWTMLDRNYDDRTREVFRTGPVYVPVWWPRYDPTFSRPAAGGTISTAPVSAPGAGGGGISLPHLPGSDFAASMVNSVQNFSSNVIGNLTDFTSNVTQKTNPVPVSTSSRSGGGRSSGGGGCACACACAGCACACAGGGR